MSLEETLAGLLATQIAPLRAELERVTAALYAVRRLPADAELAVSLARAQAPAGLSDEMPDYSGISGQLFSIKKTSNPTTRVRP